MKKMLLIDGNNMLFKAYHATSYGMMMKTSNGVPTNAVYGFVMMIEKALSCGMGQWKANLSSSGI